MSDSGTNTKIFDIKFKNMEKSIDRIEEAVKDGFKKIDNRLDKQEDTFVSKNEHKLIIKDVGYLKGGAGFILLTIGGWLIGKFLGLI